MIAQETIERIRRDVDVVALIGESVRLTKRGRSWKGLCPFHKEKTPSFHVNAERGFYHCFGCQESGDAIAFVQKIQSVDFTEAVRQLAERIGLEVVDNISEAERRQQTEVRRRKQDLYDLNAQAVAFYKRQLLEHPLRELAWDELRKRGLGESSIEKFQLGYAPHGWAELATALRASDSSLPSAEQAGLVLQRSSGGYYDRFRHRLMFPVLDLQGRVVAFSGRVLAVPSDAQRKTLEFEELGEEGGKYINSPESPIYRKRETLYGLYQARQAVHVQDRAVVVEGNFDVVTLHAHGIETAIAPLGTALTEAHVQLLRRMTLNVALAFDGDEAGRKASRLAYEVGASALALRIVALPPGFDPDSFVRWSHSTGAPGAFEALVVEAPVALEHLLEQILRQDLHGPLAAKALGEAQALLGFADPATRAQAVQYADRLVRRLPVVADTLEQLTELVRRAGTATTAQPKPTSAPPHRHAWLASVLVGLCCDFPELLEREEVWALSEHLEGAPVTALAALRACWRPGEPLAPGEVLSRLDGPIAAYVGARLAAPRFVSLEEAEGILIATSRRASGLRSSARLALLDALESATTFEEEAALLRTLIPPNL
jgi:DNA primase